MKKCPFNCIRPVINLESYEETRNTFITLDQPKIFFNFQQTEESTWKVLNLWWTKLKYMNSVTVAEPVEKEDQLLIVEQKMKINYWKILLRLLLKPPPRNLATSLEVCRLMVTDLFWYCWKNAHLLVLKIFRNHWMRLNKYLPLQRYCKIKKV